MHPSKRVRADLEAVDSAQENSERPSSETNDLNDTIQGSDIKYEQEFITLMELYHYICFQESVVTDNLHFVLK